MGAATLCISNKFPGKVGAAGRKPHFENQRSIPTPLFTKNIGKWCMVIAARKPLPGLPTAGLREIINRPACIS